MIYQVIPTVPLLACYTIDIDALLARATKLSVLKSCIASPPPGASASRASAPNLHEQLNRLRGRQIDAATDEQLTRLMDQLFVNSDFASAQSSADPSHDLASEAARLLQEAATLHNASAPQLLSDDLRAAIDSIRSSMCVVIKLMSIFLHRDCRMQALPLSRLVWPPPETFFSLGPGS